MNLSLEIEDILLSFFSVNEKLRFCSLYTESAAMA